MTEQSAPTEASERRQRIRRRRDYALIVSNLGKLAGVVFGIMEATQEHPSQLSLIFYGFLILGAQRAEDLVLNAIDRALGK